MCDVIFYNFIVTDDIDIRIRTQPRDVTVSKGGKVALSINARGEGKKSFTYEWKKLGSDSLPDTASGGNSTELTFTSVTQSDSGLYYCIVMNQWGTMVKSNNATVNVLCKLHSSCNLCIYTLITAHLKQLLMFYHLKTRRCVNTVYI